MVAVGSVVVTVVTGAAGATEVASTAALVDDVAAAAPAPEPPSAPDWHPVTEMTSAAKTPAIVPLIPRMTPMMPGGCDGIRG